jgi:hypothetical protein
MSIPICARTGRETAVAEIASIVTDKTKPAKELLRRMKHPHGKGNGNNAEKRRDALPQH